MLDERKWKQARRRYQSARSDEKKRPDMGHRGLLKVKGYAPNGGGKEEQKVSLEAAHEGELIVKQRGRCN